MGRLRAVLTWLTNQIAPPTLPPLGESERRASRRAEQESRATADRVNKLVDTWHQRAHLDMAEAEVRARVRALEIAEQDER